LQDTANNQASNLLVDGVRKKSELARIKKDADTVFRYRRLTARGGSFPIDLVNLGHMGPFGPVDGGGCPVRIGGHTPARVYGPAGKFRWTMVVVALYA
jgi:hypothetical protein